MKTTAPVSYILLLAAASIFTSSCERNKPVQKTDAPVANPISAKEYTVDAILYQQQSGEYRALAYQAFSLARLRTDEALKKKKPKEKLAIVTDLDETMLDNGRFGAHLINTSKYYTAALWSEWESLKKADSIPGSVSFLKYADSKHISIFYISNRSQKGLGSTMENMKQLGFPQVDSSNFLMRDKTSNKQERFDSIAKTYHIYMNLGDNLNDFAGVFYHQQASDRKRLTDSLSSNFGVSYIVLPNATYGDWEDAFYGYYKVDTTNDMKFSRRHSLLVDY